MDKLIPRYYQSEAFDAVCFGWESHRKVLISAACGSGKTLIATMIILGFPDTRILYLADSDILCAQPLRTFSKYGVIAALEKASERASLNARVVVASAQTLSKQNRLDRFPKDHFGIVLVDEAHRGVAMDRSVINHFESANVAGFSATPMRSDKANLLEYYDKEVFSLPLCNVGNGSSHGNMIDLGFAPPVHRIRLPIEIDLLNVKTTIGADGKDYDLTQLDTTIAPVYDKIADAMVKHASNLHNLVFLPLIKSSEAFASICRAKGLRAVHVDGTTPNRNEIYYRFERGEYQVLTNAGVASTGVDLRRADGFWNLCPTRSMVQYIQRFGRTMRTLEGVIDDLPDEDQAEERKARIAASSKAKSTVFDMLWMHDDMSVIRPEYMFAPNLEQGQYLAKRMMGKRSDQDLAEISKKTLEDREEKLRKALLKGEEKAKKAFVSLQAAAALLNNQTLLEYEPIHSWEFEKPSDHLRQELARFGVDADSVPHRGAAETIIKEFYRRSRNGLATVKQIRFINQLEGNKEKKTRRPDLLTWKQAGFVIDGLLRDSRKRHEKSVAG